MCQYNMEIPQKLDKNRGVEGKINTDGGGLNGLKRGGAREEALANSNIFILLQSPPSLFF